MLSVTLFFIAMSTSWPVTATTFTNYSDLWATPDEAGWGINLNQQGDILFGTWFVYGAGNQPVWYTGTLTYQATLANGVVVYGGNIYQTTGPAIGTPFAPSAAISAACGC